MFGVSHADPILHYLLSSLYLLYDAHQLPGVLRHFLCEGADAVGHVQNRCTDLIGFTLKDSMLKRQHGTLNHIL